MIDIKFPHLILKALYSNTLVRGRVTPYLTPDWFRENQNISRIVKKIVEYMEQYGDFPSVIESRNLVRKDTSVLEEFDAAMSIPDEEASSEYLLNEIQEFIREKLMFQVSTEIQEMLFSKTADKKDIGSFAQKLADAESFNFDTSVGFDLLEDMNEIRDELTNPVSRIPTGITEFDAMLHGGIPEEVIVALLAPTNVGKTMAMCAIAANMLCAGHDILYITFEDSRTKIGTRLLQNICDITQDGLRMLNKNSFEAMKLILKQKTSKHFKIQEYEECAINAMNLRTLLKDFREKKNFDPDVIFIDYVGCMIPNGRPNPNLNSNTVLQKIVAETRAALCTGLKKRVITALQTNRGGFGSATVDLNDVADSYGSTMKFDAVFALTQDETMKEQNLMKIKCNKTRLGNDKGKEAMLGVNIDKQQVFDIGGSKSTSANVSLTDMATKVDEPVKEKHNANNDVADNAYVTSAENDLDEISEIS